MLNSRRARQLGLSQNVSILGCRQGDRDMSLLNLADHKGGASRNATDMSSSITHFDIY